MHTVIDRPELLDSFPEEVYVPLDTDVASLFAPARLELLRDISEGQRTVSDLARSTRRKVPAVSRDLRLLERQGLIRFRVEGRRKYAELIRHFVVLPLDAMSGQKGRRKASVP
jgi:predicted transcriptional regulator